MPSENYTGAPPNHKHDGADITSGTVDADRIEAVAKPPAGLICMWHGLLANIPTGWLLCDGGSGTPDLRTKFVRGAPASTEAGGTGGSTSHTHTVPIAEAGGKLRWIKDLNTASNINANVEVTGTDISSTLTPRWTTDSETTLPPYYQVQYIMKS